MARHEYSTDIEGGAPVRVRYAITGRIDPATYLPFVLNRARWLGLDGWATAEPGRATVVAAGPEALVGALEMACTLGPLDALVTEIAVSNEWEPVAPGFHLSAPGPHPSTGSG
jgi:acylphosphatase